MVKFGDFQCPNCRNWALGPGAEIKAAYIDTGVVRLVQRHFVIFGAHSQLQAMGTECAGEQGGFWGMYDEIYGSGSFDRQAMYQVAGELGLNVPQFTRCIQEYRYSSVVNADSSYARRLQVSWVPSFIIQSGDRWIFHRGGVEPALLEFYIAQLLGHLE